MSTDWQAWAGGSPSKSGSAAPDWGGGGKQPDTNPFPYAVRCPIGNDSSAARVTLPKNVADGTTFVTDVGVEGSTDGVLPSVRGYELVGDDTVLVHLSGGGDVATGPEYQPSPYPGGGKKAVPPPPGRPFAVVLVVPPAPQYY